MDELRCDWLVGGSTGEGEGGPRLGEIQYIGSANRVPLMLQPLMAYGFVRCHKAYNEAAAVAVAAASAAAARKGEHNRDRA